MPVKSLTLSSGKTVKFGRRKPIVKFSRLQLGRYLKEPAPPTSIIYAPNASNALAQMYENDTLGDCVCAAVEHADGVFTGNAQSTAGGLVYTDANTTALYSAACGYIPGNPNTDNGCDIQTVLAYWQNNGLFGSGNKIAVIVDVNPSSLTEMQTAVYLFENLILGLDLPDAWITPFPSESGFTWDVAGPPDPNNGHCVPALGYSATAFLISTWAMTGWITNAAMAEYLSAKNGGELYCVLSPDMINKVSGVAPNALNYAQLLADINALTVPPAPAPAPPIPPPAPTPPASVGSLAWLAQNLSRGAWSEYVAAADAVAKHGSSGVGSLAWLAANLSSTSWNEYLAAVNTLARK